MLRDSHSYESQIIDAVRSVNRALGGTYGKSSAIGKNEFNQYEVQLIDAIRGIGRTLSGNGLSLAGGGDLSGLVTQKEFQSLSARVTKLESESFFRLVDGNVTLKTEYNNLWVPGWLAAGGIGEDSGGGTGTDPEAVHFTAQTLTSEQQAQARTNINAQEAFLPSSLSTGFLKYTSGSGWSLTHDTLGGLSNVNPNVDNAPHYSALVKAGNVWAYTPFQLDNLYDVEIDNSTLADGQVLKYSSGAWVNGTGGGGGSFNGGEITNDLWLHTGSANYGSTLYFGDKNGATGYAYIEEDSDDHLTIYAANGITLSVGSGKSVDIPSLSVALGGLSDVSLSSPSNGQALVYRNGLWKNETIQGGGGGATYLGDLQDVSVDEDAAHDGYVLTWNNTSGLYTLTAKGGGGGGGGGTVTSVGLSMPSCFTVTGSPVTGAGTLTATFASQTKKYVLAAPADANGAPSFRALVAGDLPSLYIGTTQVQSSSAAQDLTGISSIKATSSNTSKIVWDSTNSAWHVLGNLYADGWVSAGGVGNSGGGPSTLAGLDDVSLSSPSGNQVLYYYNGAWRNTALKTINNLSLIGSGNISISGGGGGISSVTLTSGTSNGTLKLTVDTTTTDDIAVRGLQALAYKASLAFSEITSRPTSISGYGITDAKIENGTITLGSNTITPLTSHQTIYSLTLSAGTFSAGTYDPTTSTGNSVNIPTTLDHISDGSTRKLSDYVTLATTQTITGAKTFTTNPVTIGSTSSLSVHENSHIDIGPLRIVYDSTNKALHITKASSGDANNYGIYADGFVAAGGLNS